MESNSSQEGEQGSRGTEPILQDELDQSSRPGVRDSPPPGNMFEAFARYLGTTVETAMRAVEREKSGGTHAQFMKYQPPRFSGMGAPSEAEDWMSRVEDIFDLMEVAGGQRVKLAAFQLTEQAAIWWKATKPLLSTPLIGDEQPVGITWEKFKGSFNEKYFPEAYKLEKRREFVNLKQEKGMSVQEYEVQFTALSRFARRLIEDEYEKCRKFQDGLLPAIRGRLAVLDLRNYLELVHKAKLVEGEWKETTNWRESQKRNRDEFKVEGRESQGSKRQDRGRGERGIQSDGRSRKNEAGGANYRAETGTMRPPKSGGLTGELICYRCGRAGHYSRECPMIREDECYNCGGKGHYARECKAGGRPAQSATVSSGRGRGRGRTESRGDRSHQQSGGMARVYALTQKEADSSPHVVTGMISISNFNAYTLIDSAATHSFASEKFCKNFPELYVKMKNPLEVTTPLRDGTMISGVYKNCKIMIERKCLVGNLLPLKMYDFDVILGMDWLSKHHALINCFNKEVIFQIPGEAELVFRGTRRILPTSLISSSKAEKMVKKGCE